MLSVESGCCGQMEHAFSFSIWPEEVFHAAAHRACLFCTLQEMRRDQWKPQSLVSVALSAPQYHGRRHILLTGRMIQDILSHGWKSNEYSDKHHFWGPKSR